MKPLNAMLKITLVAQCLTLVACASTTTVVNEDRKAALKSQNYLQNVTYAPAGSHGTAGVCGKEIAPSKDWKQLTSRAGACVTAKNWRTLESIANVMGQADIDSPWGSYFLSVAAEGQGDFKRALWMIDLAQKKAGGGSGLFLYQRAHVLYKMGEVGKAIDLMKKSVAIEPKLIEGHIFLAEVSHRDGDQEQATRHYEAALEAEPGNYKALAALAKIRVPAQASVNSADEMGNAK